MKAKKKYWVLLIFIIILVYLFWGPLFPWNPIKIGYTKIGSSKATIYIDDITPNDSVVYRINELIQEEEKFHNMTYVNNFKIVVLSKESNMKRYLPWLKGSDYSVSLSIADLIYIGPNARKSLSGIKPYLKHELSHLLIDQNTTFKKSLTIHEQGWLTEGIAEYFSGHSFLSKDEFLKLCAIRNFDFKTLLVKNPLEMSLQEIRMQYTYYKYFIEFLVENYGIKKLQEYLSNYIKDPEDYRNLFVKVYNKNLNKLLEENSLLLK